MSILDNLKKFVQPYSDDEYDDEEYDEDEDEYLTDNISSSNFHKYIYGGGTTDWTGVENYDGCSALASKPAL